MTVRRLLPALFLSAVLLSCADSAETVDMKRLDGRWPKNDEQKFSFSISDAQNPKNIIFVVRNNNDYPYSNIRLIVKLNEGKRVLNADTLNYILAQPDGTWLGKGFGDTKEIMFQYKLNYKFPRNAKYEIGVTQAMRADSLKGIEDIGVKIETLKP